MTNHLEPLYKRWQSDGIERIGASNSWQRRGGFTQNICGPAEDIELGGQQ
ncbi:MAG: hypothetical protein KME26_04745 [Oscillatoria princeps RMCB-10]|nr:hypothetical protein [Oscillatoria princeps RMCB-10]